MIVSYDHQPSIIQPVGDGRFYYRWNIQEITEESHFSEEESGNSEPITSWTAQEIVVPLLQNNIITATAIAETWDASYEQKLVNDYNAAMLGVFEEAEKQEKINAYTQFLSERAILKAQINADCKSLGIK